MANSGAALTLVGEVEEVKAAVRENRGWFIGLGILMIVLGIGAIGFPFATTIAAKIMIGWLFLIAGIALIIQAFSMNSWKSLLGNLLIALLYVVVGVWLAFLPLAGIVSLTLLLALAFIAEGGLKLGMGFKLRPMDGWVWIVISAVIAILAGVLLIAGLPGTATWAIGLLVGVNLLGSGLSFLMVGMTAGKE